MGPEGQTEVHLSLYRDIECGLLMPRFSSVPNILVYTRYIILMLRVTTSIIIILGGFIRSQVAKTSFLNEELHWIFILFSC